MFKPKEKRSVKEKQTKGSCDPSALGNLLLRSGSITLEQLRIALKEQLNERDERLGNILVEKGFLDEELLEFFIRKQRVLQTNYSSKEVMRYVNVAKERTQTSSNAHNELMEAALTLATKLKG